MLRFRVIGRAVRAFVRRGDQLPARFLLYRSSVELALLKVIIQRKLGDGLQLQSNLPSSLLHWLGRKGFVQVTGVCQSNGVVAHVRRPSRSLSRVVGVLRAANLLAYPVSDGVIILRYLSGGVEGRSPIIQRRPEAMYVRGAGGFGTCIVLPIVVRGRDFEAAFPFVVAEASTSQVSVSPVEFELQVGLQVSMGLAN